MAVAGPTVCPPAIPDCAALSGTILAKDTALRQENLKMHLHRFKPFAGVAAFYLAVHWRLRRRAKPMPADPAETMRKIQTTPR